MYYFLLASNINYVIALQFIVHNIMYDDISRIQEENQKKNKFKIIVLC